ncbi:F-box/LRR-repeat protein 18-like [Liolophura sinensis]|uniref:F-box/LRR-repeat protein 18-like n=1 Tax=Liolophura sinensis TaxID=3198878 RepID=UPI0031585F97
MICFDVSLVRHTCFEASYQLSDEILTGYLSAASTRIENLNCNHCYWLSGQVLQSTLRQCKNLHTLSVIDCNLTPKRLCGVVARLEKLERLSFSVVAIRDFCVEFATSPGAQERFRQLKELVIHFKRGWRGVQDFTISINVVQQTTFLEFCENLEKLSVIGAPNSFPKDLLRPQIENFYCLRKLKEVGINDKVDPAARLFFFGILGQLRDHDISFKTVLIPAANFAQLQNRAEFRNCFRYSSELCYLNLSRIQADIMSVTSPVPSISQGPRLLYLNISDNYKADSSQLKTIAECCPNLISLNLQNCPYILMNSQTGKMETCGIEALVNRCSSLQDFNLSGVHVHSVDGPHPVQTLCSLVSLLKGLQRLALPACCLCTPETEEAIPTTLVGKKKVRVSYSAPQGFGKRRRLGLDSSSQSQASTSDGWFHESQERSYELNHLTSGCPNIQHFELIGAGFRSVFNSLVPINFRRHSYTACAEAHTVSDDDLMPISKWRQLTSLQLSGLPGMLHGKSLVHIARGCQKLEYLRLAFLGSGAHWGYLPTLCQALREMNNLKDFRLEQHNVTLNAIFFEALATCQKLERLCVVSQNGTLTAAALETCIEKISSLVVIQLFTGATLTLSKKLQADLISRYSVSRPALSVVIYPAAHDELPNMIRGIPAKHYDSFLLLDSHVATKPADW